MNTNNTNSFIKDSSSHIININRALKNIKLNVMANFIHMDNKDIIITTNNTTSPLDLQKYVKSSVCINTEQVKSPRLPQFKLYLKIIGILYLSKCTNTYIISDKVEKFLKSNYIFNNIMLALKPRIIKVFPKSDISIIWIDIWNTQSRSKAKCLINRRFNVGSFITTIQRANMNLDISQYKNC